MTTFLFFLASFVAGAMLVRVWLVSERLAALFGSLPYRAEAILLKPDPAVADAVSSREDERLEIALRDMRLANENLKRTQERCTALLEENLTLKGALKEAAPRTVPGTVWSSSPFEAATEAPTVTAEDEKTQHLIRQMRKGKG